MTPDRHRQRVYDAEDAAFGGTLLDAPVPWNQLVTVFGTATHHRWWVALGVREPSLRPARSDSARSSSDGRSIRISPIGCTPLTVAHELAHHLVAALDPLIDGAAEPAHGPMFRAAELRTVALIGGTAARTVLEGEWRRWGLPPGHWGWPEPPDGPGLALRGVIAL
ncbi:MAG: hypothetical protein JJE52_02745 [Acidimicrobiia bacterium]|nr:hypothetical protein [Acidimicrobiia bacterium]